MKMTDDELERILARNERRVLLKVEKFAGYRLQHPAGDNHFKIGFNAGVNMVLAYLDGWIEGMGLDEDGGE